MIDQSPRLSVRSVIYKDEAILLAKHHDERGDWYVVPGGGVQHGEDLHTALHREVDEELGATVRIGDLVCAREIQSLDGKDRHLPPDFHQVELFFLCDLLSMSQPASQMDRRQIGFEWVKLKDLDKIMFFPKNMVSYFQQQSFPQRYFGVIE